MLNIVCRLFVSSFVYIRSFRNQKEKIFITCILEERKEKKKERNNKYSYDFIEAGF